MRPPRVPLYADSSRAALLLVAAMLGSFAAQQANAGSCPTFAPGASAGNASEPLLLEASGLVASRAQPGVLWTHNDSGATATLFALAPDGTALATVHLTDAANVDWEDMALGPGPDPEVDYLYVGDIGDNAAARDFVRIYRVPEPTLGEPGEVIDWSGAVALDARYPEGARDAETLLSDPRTGDLYIVSKDFDGESRVYRHAFPQAESGITLLEGVADLTFTGANLLVRSTTAGDITPAGDAIAIRTYTLGSLWLRGEGQSVADALAGEPCPIPIAFEPQGESLGFAADGASYFTLSERASQPVYEYVQLPEPEEALLRLAACLALLASHAAGRRRLRGGPKPS